MSDVRDLGTMDDVGATSSPRWVTDGGLETDLIFHHGIDLPAFAAYPLLDDTEGRALLSRYYTAYAQIARAARADLLLETPTWRANPDWVSALGGSADEVRRINLESVVFLAGLVAAWHHEWDGSPVPTVRVSGTIGPRGDGYVPGAATSAQEFADYHSRQIEAFAQSGIGRVTAYTLTTRDEAVGIVQAARAYGVEVGVAFTVETDGRLPDGMSLGEAVGSLWEQAAPDALLINCAHPSHIANGLREDDSWAPRVTGLRVNASRQSHAELDAAEVLDEGDIPDLVTEHEALLTRLPSVEVVGGCCGTDSGHVAALWGVGT